MNTALALLANIIENPEDDDLRLVFADWLEENGQADRADLIRVQCELHGLPDEADRRTQLEIRERRLLARHAADWAAPRPMFPSPSLPSPLGNEREGYWSVFRRGLLEGVALHELSPEHLQPGGEFERLFSVHPIREVQLRRLRPGSLSALADRPELARIEALELTEFADREETEELTRQRVTEVETLLGSTRLERLRSLELTLFPTAVGAPARWLQTPGFSRLQKLHAWPRDEDREGWWDILTAGACPQLVDLRLPWGYAGERAEAVSRFARSPACQRLTRLGLSKADGGQLFPWADVFSSARLGRLEVTAGSGAQAPDLLDALASVPGTNELRSLRLFGFTATGAGVARWLEKGYAVGVRDLAVECARLNDDDLEQLAATPALGRLTRLNLSGYSGCTPRGWQKFLASPYLSGLRRLDLSDTGLTAAGVLQIARSGALSGLRVLCLGELISRQPGRSPVMNLVRGKPFPNLHTLKAWFFEGDQEPAELNDLLSSPKLPNLAVLRTGFPVARGPAWERFASDTRLDWVGGSTSDGLVTAAYVALHPRNVYLPNHLDDFGW